MGQKFIPKFKKSAKWYCKEIHSSKTIRPGKRQASQQQCVGAVTAFSNGFFASQVNVMISGKYPWLRNSFAIQKKIGVTFTCFSQIILYLQDCVNDSKRRRNDRNSCSSVNLWKNKQLTDSSSMENWLKAKKKLGKKILSQFSCLKLTCHREC